MRSALHARAPMFRPTMAVMCRYRRNLDVDAVKTWRRHGMLNGAPRQRRV